MNGRTAAREGTGVQDPYKWRALLFAAVLATSLPMTLGVTALLQDPEPVDPFQVAAERLGVERAALVLGSQTFQRTCIVCHGAEGQGVPRLGKPLKNSAYVQSHTDEQVLAVVLGGRPPSDPANTTGMLMPARGANPALSEASLRNVVSYIRMLQEPGAPVASLEAWTRPAEPPAGTAMASEAAGTGGAAAGPDVSASAAAGALADAPGHAIFVASCSACHGEQGQGLDGLGKPLAGSAFVQSKTDEELAAFVKQGRPIWDALNTTGVDMPPKGGNPALNDSELAEIIRFIRSIQPAPGDA